ncbi:DUF2071 domain-containing protein [Nonomuraea sp. NN258]|uniref:YqjF family protein n=1 Tax=Nonomuraea antri TaxID=2730852 RepID=UPI001569A5A7|nr:DUF2071 domain-containing protein [Nonomuraea antri]NRQ35317.1 DUF2071 domain-containing protein [Nonomuraea antri]
MRAPPSAKVDRPVMHHRWSTMTFMHWRYPRDLVAALVPGSFTVETFDGSAWVGLTPFLMSDVRAPGTPALPWLSRFPETNLRTYVRDAEGRPGVWFLSLDAGRLPAAIAGRGGYGLPYYWSGMSVDVAGPLVRYRCRRRWPSSRGTRCDANVETGPPLTDGEHDELAFFLTARFRLFSLVADRPVAAEVEHPPWPLRRARLIGLDQDLVQAAGLPAPDGPPLLHASTGVPVRVGLWNWVRPGDGR